MTPITCPHCGHTLPIERILQNQQTGVAHGHCRQCEGSFPILLPSIRKKLVYLDQSFLSAACLEVNKPTSQNEVRILSKLEELKIRQRIFVVVSDVHSRETSAIPDEHVESRRYLWQFQNDLADGCIAYDSDEVFIAQWRRLLSDKENPNSFPASDIGLDDPHRLQIGMRIQFTNQWRQKSHHDHTRPRDLVNEAFRNVIERQLENMPNCRDVHDCLSYVRKLWHEDIRQGIVALQNRRKSIAQILKDQNAGRKVDYTLLETADAPFCRIVREVVQGLDEESTLQRWLELLEEDSASLCASVRISSALETALLWKLKTRVVTSNPKKFDIRFGQSRWNDIDHISTFAPYVDALTTDNDMRNLCENAAVANELKRFSCKLFSKSNYDEFETWLDTLLAEPVTHIVRG